VTVQHRRDQFNAVIRSDLDPVCSSTNLPADSLTTLINTVCGFSTEETLNALAIKVQVTLRSYDR